MAKQVSSSAARPQGTTLPEFDVLVATVRCGSHTIRVEAADATAARELVQSDCDDNQCHCPPEWCTDDIESSATEVRAVVLDGVTLITAEGVGLGTLYADDSLRQKRLRTDERATPSTPYEGVA